MSWAVIFVLVEFILRWSTGSVIADRSFALLN